MTKNDALSFFAKYIEGDELFLPNNQQIAVDSFLNVAGFSELPSSPTATDMRNIDNNAKGYEQFIQQCENDGLFN